MLHLEKKICSFKITDNFYLLASIPVIETSTESSKITISLFELHIESFGWTHDYLVSFLNIGIGIRTYDLLFLP